MTSITIANYAEDPKTIHLYPFDLYDDDLTPDCGVEIDDICTEIYEACKGWGKDSKRLVQALGNTLGEDRRRIAIRFPEMYDKDLTQLMKDECGNNNEMGAATQFLSVGPVEAECLMLNRAMDGLGADKVMMYSILCGRSNEDMYLLKKTYYKMFTEDLTARVGGEAGSSDMRAILMAALQAAEEEFDPDYHTEDKAVGDAETLYKAGQGRWGTDEATMAKIIVMSPPKYLKMLNSVYCDKYGYTLMKAFEKEF